MLDYPSSKSRKWAGTGLLLIFFGIASRGEHNGAANSWGTNFSHSYHAGKRAESCTVAYFQLVQQQRNVHSFQMQV